MKYCLFGAGEYGKRAISLVGRDNVKNVFDNDSMKWDSLFDGIIVCRFESSEICNVQNKEKDECIIISVSPEKSEDIIRQLESNGIKNYIRYEELVAQITREKILARTDYISVYQKAVRWIREHSIDREGIINSTYLPQSYPEVTGYFIPSLLKWGHRRLAYSYAEWLCSIQKPDGSWYNTEDTAPYIFDTAQVLKGLLAVRKDMPQVDVHILAGCEWILAQMQKDGRLVTPTKDAWGDDRSTCDEVIHIYCLSPLLEAARIYQKPEYKEKALRIWSYYKENYYAKIMDFNLLSHFHAYLMEALLDIGEREMAREAMGHMEKYQKQSGAVPAYRNCDWVCSTGLFQLALVWFRLGDIERGNKAFEYACKLQNESGGWFGSYLSEDNAKESNTYFPVSEISWAAKYFLDALYYKNVAEFEMKYDSFLSSIDKADGRYQLIRKEIREIPCRGMKKRILDVGCGKGRYLRNLAEDMPDCQYAAVDISEKVMETFGAEIAEKRQGSLTNIPFDSNAFDVVYTCEALEHAIDIGGALREMERVCRPGGKIIIIDKNIKALGRFEIDPWEQWFDENALKKILEEGCTEVMVHNEIPYEGKDADGLFCAWVGKVKE